MNKVFCWFVKLTGWPLYLLSSRPKYYYIDKKVQGRHIKGSAIVVCNHKKLLDFSAMMYAFPRRNLRCIIAEVIYQKGYWMTKMLNALGSIKVDRNANDFTFIDKACDALKKGYVVEIYPESRLPGDDETELLPFKPSVAYILLQSGAPIVPMATNGCYGKRERARILFGTPVTLEELIDPTLSEAENITLICDKLRNIILGLCDELKNRTDLEKEKKRK